MEPLSAAASVIACYQLASEVGCQCLRYVRGVRQAHKDGDFVIAQIQMFQLSLHHLQGMLANEAGNQDGGSRLELLREIMDGGSGSLVQCSKELEELRAKLVKAHSGGNLREILHKLAWPLKQEEIERAMMALNSFAAAIDRGLAIDSNKVVRGIDSTTKDINSKTKQILISTETAEAQQRLREKLRREEEERKRAEEIREQILDWLAHPDPSEIHNIASRARKSTKTGKWFLHGTPFQAFKTAPQSILWLHGDSGCGKSILCSAVIDELRAIRSKEPRFLLAYWYFSVNDANRRSLQNLVRALFTQLCPPLAAPPALFRLWDANRKGREAPQASESVQTLIQMLREISLNEDYPSLFIVIDALDESNESERTDIIDMLRRIVSLDIDIHLLITSRSSTVGVEQRLQDAAKFFNVVIEHQLADEDILTHISERLQDDENLNKWPPRLRKDIEEVLTANAAGMFRWVDCQLQAICRCMKPKELKKALTSLSKDLREVYAKEVANVEDRAVEDVRKLLGWLTYPQRPLRIEEAAEILAVDLDSDPPGFDEDNRMPRPEDILQICGSLVRIDKNPEGRDSLGHRAEVQTLTAAHASVVDFLKEEHVRIGRKREAFYTRAAVNLEMTETCLVYLLNLVEGQVVLSDENIMSYPFARFSAELWDDFYREVVTSPGESDVDMTRANALVMRLFMSREYMLKWIQLCDPDDDASRVQFDLTISHVKPVVYYAALLGLPGIVSRLLKERHSIDERVSGDCGTPLIAACVYGRENVVSILLQNGANPNLAVNKHRGCPIAAAIEQNQWEIVKLLLKTRCVEVNARRFPPNSASTTRSDLVPDVSKITANGMDNRAELEEITGDMTVREDTKIEPSYPTVVKLETEDLYFPLSMNDRIAESLLYIAVNSESLETVNALLEAGADPNIQGGPEWTALQIACCKGSFDIVETLLKHGANAAIYGGKSGSPLQAACAFPSLRIVKLLVGVSVDVNYVGHGENSPLYIASQEQYLQMVGLLLDHGAKTDLYGGLYDNPLLIASYNGDIPMVQLLLGAGSNVNRKGGEMGTALNAACYCQSIDVVRVLLEHGSDPNIQGCFEYDNALQTACEGDNESIVLLLLEHGADPNLHGGWYGSALHAAFSKGNERAVRALLAKGADIRYRGGEYCTILHAAVVSEDEALVKLALECGLSPNEKGGWFTYPLLRAIGVESCPDSIVWLLLEAGADLSLEREGDSITERTFRTALQHAASVSKATLLLDHGAEVNKVSGMYGTALHTTMYVNAEGDQKNRILKLLVERGADVNKFGLGPPLIYAAREAQLDSASLLVEAGAVVDLVDTVGLSALHMAICRSKADMELFDYFVDLGLSPLQLDRRGCNGLHYAARKNNLLALKRILKSGCDVNARDDFGWTPLHWAAASTQESAQVVAELLNEGSDVDMRDKAGKTALDLANQFGNTELVAMLNGMTKPSDIRVTTTIDEEPLNFLCDGCSIVPDFCASEDWYRCKECEIQFDLCFRCILDKDTIHDSSHSWSSEPSFEIKGSPDD